MGILGGLLRRRFRLALQPVRDVIRISGSSEEWQASGIDPSFLLVSNRRGYPSGWVLFQSGLVRQGRDRTAKLYYDAGDGFSANGFVFVPVSAAGTINEVIELPRRLVSLRWDPMESTGCFTQQPISITEITWIEGIARMMLGIVRTTASHPDTAGRLTFRELIRLIPDAKKRYDLTRHARNLSGYPPAAKRPSIEPRKHALIRRLRPNAGRLLNAEAARRSSDNYNFYLDVFNEQELSGWVVNTKSPHTPVEVDLYLNGEFVARKVATLERIDVAAAGHGGSRCGFFFSIPWRFRQSSGLRATLCPAGSRIPLDGCSYIYTPRELLVRGALAAVETLTRIGESSGRQLSSSLPATSNALACVRQAVFPALLKKLRAEWLQLPNVLAVADDSAPVAACVDVIIPAYRGLDETIACVESVMKARVHTLFELVVINDCSPEPQLTAALKSLSGKHGFLLLENGENHGFVRTANRGMMLHVDRDVVLLNSDTVVTDGWLDRMRNAAYADVNIGTVTPFSNRATICSFPLSAQDNDLPQGMSIDELAAACAKVNDRQAIDIPTAVGFCMYIRRAALRETGYFDEVLWEKGYGEENDFCLRASSLGWRHVIACDAFVAHHGAVSFAEQQSSRRAQNLETLNRVYPDYNGTIALFIRTDPIAPARRRLFIELARSHAPRYMLFVAHSWGGGAEVASTGLAERLAANGEAVLFLTAPTPSTLLLRIFGSNLVLEYRGGQQYQDLLEDLRQLNVWHLHVHQLPGFSPDIYDFLLKFGVPYDITVHDYYYICPRIHLTDGSDIYCGEPDENACNACLKSSGTHESCRDTYQRSGANIIAWRAWNAALLKQARLIIAPSKDVETRMRKYFPLKHISIKPHPESARKISVRAGASVNLVTVALIGAIGPHKGFNVLKACAEDANTRSLPLRFVVIGYTHDDYQLRALNNVVITGAYSRSDLGRLIAEYSCSVAAFFNVAPETFSFALSEAWAHGLFPTVFDLGAHAERVRANGFGLVVPLHSSPGVINDLLIRAAIQTPREPLTRNFGTDYPNLLTDYYHFRASRSAQLSLP